MSRSIFNVRIVRKYLDIFRRQYHCSEIQANRAGKSYCIRQYHSNYLTSHFPPSTGYIINPNPPQTIPKQPAPEPTPAPITMPILPNHRLLARAFHRVPTTTTKSQRNISTSASHASKTDDKSNSSNWKGRHTEDHIVQSDDSHNVQKDASNEGFEERAKGDGSSATSEKDEMNLNEKAKKDHPEAPGPVIGMNDERGGKGH